MSREDAVTKGRRYASEGRLTVTRAERDLVVAVCRGSGAIHRCGHAPAHGWWCTCPSKSLCSHVAALQPRRGAAARHGPDQGGQPMTGPGDGLS